MLPVDAAHTLCREESGSPDDLSREAEAVQAGRKIPPRLADRKQVLSFDKTPWPRSGNYSPDIPDEQA
jgi:hypothetical protein